MNRKTNFAVRVAAPSAEAAMPSKRTHAGEPTPRRVAGTANRKNPKTAKHAKDAKQKILEGE